MASLFDDIGYASEHVEASFLDVNRSVPGAAIRAVRSPRSSFSYQMAVDLQLHGRP